MAEGEAYLVVFADQSRSSLKRFVKKYRRAAEHFRTVIIPAIAAKPTGEKPKFEVIRPAISATRFGVRQRFDADGIACRVAYLVDQEQRSVRITWVGAKKDAPKPNEYIEMMRLADQRE